MAKTCIARRDFVTAAGAAALMPWPTLAQAKVLAGSGQMIEPGRIAFAVSRNGSPIGLHRIEITEKGGLLSVDINIELTVKVAFITFYDYRHHNREFWDDQGLVQFNSQTNDNGTRHRVKAGRQADQLVIEGSEGTVNAPLASLPTTYWQRRFMATDQWIDTQVGRLINSTVSAPRTERIQAMGQLIEAERFELRGDLDLDLWYQGENWVKLQFEASDGSMIEYALESSNGQIIGV